MKLKPYRLVKILKHSKKSNLKVLDVGAGSHSSSITKKWIPNCEYHGIDLKGSYQNTKEDIALMDEFFELDLTTLDFDKIADKQYDLIIMSHIIEHLYNGDEVITKLLNKLKENGVIYIEYPSIRSAKLPSMRDTLNFFDDPTHCRFYTLPELYNLLMNEKMEILEGGTRRYWRNILLVPIKVIVQLIIDRRVKAGVFWDITGFAEYVIAKKTS